MNKAEIKQIILEEIKATLKEMASAELLAADSRPEEDDMGFTDDDISPEDLYGADVPPFISDEEAARRRGELAEMARTPNVFAFTNPDVTPEEVRNFMDRVNTILIKYKSPGQKKPKKRFTPEEMDSLISVMFNPKGFTSKDIIDATSYNSPPQANKFLKALEMKGYIKLTTQLKKAMEPTRDPNAPETRGRKKKGAEFTPTDDPMSDLDALGLGGDIDLSDPLAENNNTMSELEKYIKQVIKEAKNPLANKMKEIENQGRIAALETKLAAIQEMIDETEDRLTRIDEDNEFNEMMDKTKVKEVRKQLKELEKAKGKLEKERAKMEGKASRPKKQEKEIVDEAGPDPEFDDMDDFSDFEDLDLSDPMDYGTNENKLDESALRMQKLAGLITESDIKKKNKKINERYLSGEQLLDLVKDNQRDIIKKVQKKFGGKIPISTNFELKGDAVITDAGTPGTMDDYILRIGTADDHNSVSFPDGDGRIKKGMIGYYDASKVNPQGGGRTTLLIALDKK